MIARKLVDILDMSDKAICDQHSDEKKFEINKSAKPSHNFVVGEQVLISTSYLHNDAYIILRLFDLDGCEYAEVRPIGGKKAKAVKKADLKVIGAEMALRLKKKAEHEARARQYRQRLAANK
ncbi:hypothetical protein [Acinetobacter chengduensis]|uniref:Uncharacterized protein n=1 Tax=Acinetobacter chengduensis TaxID=2420890 RepID=A0ABX9TSL9_9GAMM|nr:hypothetical protein [Acinetobacter chengduensis]RLL19009.1 hypothetical protein D9K81_14735 [Acinetobacter chengduensis]